MFRRQCDVPRTRARNDISPSIRIKELGAKHGGEIEIGEVSAVDPLMEFPRRTVCLHVLRQRVPIPLRIAGLAFHIDGGEGRHRVHAPMDEDPEFRVRIPLGTGAPVERGPVCFVAGLGGGGHRERYGGHRAEQVSP